MQKQWITSVMRLVSIVIRWSGNRIMHKVLNGLFRSITRLLCLSFRLNRQCAHCYWSCARTSGYCLEFTGWLKFSNELKLLRDSLTTMAVHNNYSVQTLTSCCQLPAASNSKKNVYSGQLSWRSIYIINFGFINQTSTSYAASGFTVQ